MTEGPNRADSGRSHETDGGVTTTGDANVTEPTDIAEAPEVTESTDGQDSSALRQIATVAGMEFRLSVRNRWAVALAALFTLFASLIVGFGASSVGPVRADAVIVSMASLATYLLPLAALVFGFDAVVGAEERGWLDIVFALPVSRARVVVGSYLGRAVTLVAATSIGFGIGGILLFSVASSANTVLYATFLLGSVALGLGFLAVGVFVSSVVGEKTHALGAALLVWVWFVFGHDLLALGLVAGSKLPQSALSVMVLSNPVSVFRVFVLSGIDSTGGGLATVVGESTLSMPLLAVAATVWVVVPVAAAARAVRHRSL
ncbi:ABC transporter permease [Halogeometricum borinquense]|uniref:ABC transporter permease n=1 Tax=Halogeometricum borinquense TaxID=60847 RepID=A0A482T1I5_9EURY|nr:ABC transporter permease [Halogeometricum borinquense]RYJ08570.1 ABC transporter permease [Halogeometricum borinquense]